MEKRFLNVKDVAVYLSVSEDTIRAWVKRGYIPYSKLGRAVRFDLRSLEVWIRERERSIVDK